MYTRTRDFVFEGYGEEGWRLDFESLSVEGATPVLWVGLAG
ncbi:MAG: hypothetical protein WBQ79_02735 [Acidobacteriaceae bacterium]